MHDRRHERRVAAVFLVTLALVAGAAVFPLIAAAVPEEEPNDELSSATPIQVGETVTGEIPDEGDEDWFAVDVEKGETVNVSTTIGEGSGLKVRIYDPNGNKLGGPRGGDETIVGGRTATETGTYYVRIFHWTGDGATPYEMTVRTYETTEREPNEDRDNATAIAVGETIRDERSIGDIDWYAYEVDAGETINLTGEVGPGAGLEFTIVRPDGESVNGDQGSDTSIIAGATATESGTWYLEVHKSGGSLTADYSVTIRTSETTDREPNEDEDNATPLEPNTTVEDTISLGDRDWYAVDLQQGDSLVVSGTVGPRAGNQFQLRAPNGTALNKSAGRDGPYVVTAVAPETGTHHIRVTRNNFPGADYTMEVRTNGTGEIDGAGTDAGGGRENGDIDDDDEAGGDSGLPLVPIAVVLALVVILVGLLLWRRSGDDGRGGERRGGGGQTGRR